MKRYAYATKSGSELRLLGFDDRKPLSSPADQSAIMASRLDFDVRIIELPAMGEKETEGFLTYRMRSLYPGQPDQTAFDYRILNRGAKRYAVLFLVQRGILEEYRQAVAGRPLFSSFSLLLALADKQDSGGKTIGLFWHDNWLEALVLGEGEMPRSIVVRRGRDPASDLAQLTSLAPDDLQVGNCLAVCPEEELAALRELLGSRLSESCALTVLSAQEALRRLARGPELLFEKRRSRPRIPRSLRLQLYLGLILLLSFLAFKRTVDHDAAFLSQLRRELQAAQGRTTQVAALQKEIDALKAQQTARSRQQLADPYRVLAELRSVLPPGTRINSFVIEKGSFQMEAVGSNPLQLMEVFKTRDMFENVKLIQIVPLKSSVKELFRITGYAHAQ